MDDTKDRWFYRGLAILVSAAGLCWLLAPLSFWQEYAWIAPWATGAAAGLAAVVLFRWYRARPHRPHNRPSSFGLYSYHVITVVYVVLLGQMNRDLTGEAAWLGTLGLFAFYGTIVVCLQTIQRYFDSPQRSDDKLIASDPPEEYNILLVVLGSGALLLYFLIIQPQLQYLPGKVQRIIGFFVFLAAYLGAQWFGYRYLRSNRVRPPRSG